MEQASKLPRVDFGAVDANGGGWLGGIYLMGDMEDESTTSSFIAGIGLILCLNK
jgi:hypothetical protein